MSLLAVTALVLLVLLAVAVAQAVHHDGYGSLEPPRSHPRDDATSDWPGRPV